jgi:hypothetical protein
MINIGMKTNRKVQIIKPEDCKEVNYDSKKFNKKMDYVRKQNEKTEDFKTPNYERKYQRFKV